MPYTVPLDDHFDLGGPADLGGPVHNSHQVHVIIDRPK